MPFHSDRLFNLFFIQFNAVANTRRQPIQSICSGSTFKLAFFAPAKTRKWSQPSTHNIFIFEHFKNKSDTDDICDGAVRRTQRIRAGQCGGGDLTPHQQTYRLTNAHSYYRSPVNGT